MRSALTRSAVDCVNRGKCRGRVDAVPVDIADSRANARADASADARAVARAFARADARADARTEFRGWSTLGTCEIHAFSR